MNAPRYCNVAVVKSGGRILTYDLGAAREISDLTGRRVIVPLGGRKATGIIIETLREKPPFKVKPILDLLDDVPAITEDILALSRWISEYYICDPAEALKAALPAELLHPPRKYVRWIGSEFEGQWPAQVLENRSLLGLARIIVSRMTLSVHQLARLDRLAGLHIRLKKLEEAGLVVTREPDLPDPEKVLTREIVYLAEGADPDSVPESQRARKRILDAIAGKENGVSWSDLRNRCKVTRTVLTSLERDGLAVVRREARDRMADGYDPRGSEPLPELTGAQQACLDAVSKAGGDSFRMFLLVGPPGSGKTRVYLELIRREVERGGGVLLLVPEISLTPQVVSRIRSALDCPVAVLHSSLTPAQRIAVWRSVREGRVKVVVGVRSAVFAPLQDLRLVIVDEEHEESYKQNDPAPRYHARDVAIVRARNTGAKIVLVSATPSLESLRLTDIGAAERIDLVDRFGAGWPKISIVDRRRASANAPFIGRELAAKIREKTRRGEGILLMITRRGFAPVLVCRDCGERVICPHCDISLTIHRGTGEARLKCHLCGYSTRPPEVCAKCGSVHLVSAGAGTQRIESEILKRFPELEPIRMDSDTTRRGGKHEEILRSFGEGRVQLLLGTQMVAKGHDFAHVTLVGIVNADTSLFIPDFRATERTFRLLVQAAGRAGRGEKPGEVIVQTLDPENPVFLSLIEPDTDGFLKREAKVRETFHFPPFARMATVTIVSHDLDSARKSASIVAEDFRKIGPPLMVIGPVETMVAKVKQSYRFRIALRTRRGDDAAGKMLRDAIRKVKRERKLPGDVDWIVDVDPVVVA